MATFTEEAIIVPVDSGGGKVFRPYAFGAGRWTATMDRFWEFWQNNVTDPDPYIYSDGYDEKLRQIPYIHSALELREETVASFPWDIEAASGAGIDEKEATTIRDYVKEVIGALPNISELYRTCQTAVSEGGIGFEFGWAQVEGCQRPVGWHPLKKSNFSFDREGGSQS